MQEASSVEDQNILLQKEDHELNEKLKVEKDFRDREHSKQVERLKSQVAQYRDEAIELKAKVETISLAAGLNPSQLPSAVRQLETKVRELYKQKDQQTSLHESEVKRLVEDCEEKAQRAVTLAASNTLLKVQLSETQEKMKQLNVELSTCRKKMEQDLLETEMWEQEMAEIGGNDEHGFAVDGLNQVLDRASTLQKDLHSTKASTIQDLKTLNKEMIAIIRKMQDSFQREFTKCKSLSDVEETSKLKEEKCGKLQEEIASLLSTMSDEKAIHESIVSELKTELLSIKLSSKEKEEALEENTRKLEDKNQKLVCDYSELVSRLGKNEEESSQVPFLRSTIESLKEKIDNLEESKMVTQAQIEEIESNKLEIQRKLVLSEGRVKRYEEDMNKLQGTKEQLARKLKDMEVQANGSWEQENEIQSEMQKKAHLVKSLEQKLLSSQEEICVLQKTISRLNSEKLEANDHIGTLNLKIKSNETDMEAMSEETASIQKSNKSLLMSIVELQRANSILEVEKRSLEQSLCNASDTKATLGIENAELNKQQLADKDELQYIQTSNKQLNSKIEELDKNLAVLEFTCIKLKTEKDELSQEAYTLSDAISKLRRALSEVQIQRGKLSQSIAKAAQEKGELVQEKMQLTSDTTRLQANLQTTRDELEACKSERKLLESVKERMDEKVAHCQKEIESLTQNNLSLQEQKQQLVREHGDRLRLKDDVLRDQQSKHSQEKEQLVSESKIKECELQKQLRNEKICHSSELSDLKSKQEKEILALKEDCKEKKESLEMEIAALKEVFESELAKMTHEKEITVQNLKRQQDSLTKDFVNQKTELQKQLSNLKMTNREAENTVNKLRSELKSNEKSIDTLGKELNSNEEQLLALQEMLDKVKREAQNHLDDLQSDLLEATTTNSQVEQKYQDAQATVKQLTNSRSHYQGLLETAQNEINHLEHNNDILTGEKRSLERHIDEVNSQLKKEKESVAILESLKEKAEVGKAFAITESGKIRKSLLFAEESLAKLSSEHNSLQQLLTEMQKEASDLKGRVSLYKTANSKMENQIQEKETKLSELKDKLVVITKLHNDEQQRNEGLHAILNAAEEEKSQLKLSFGRLQQTFTTQNQEMSSTIALLNKSQQEMKSQKAKLVTDITKQEVQLEREMKSLEKLREEFDTLKHEKTVTELELEKATEFYRHSCMAYNQLAAVLTGCFNEEFEPSMQDNEQRQKMAVFDTSFESSGIVSKSSPLGMKLKFLDNSKIVQAIRNLQSTTFELRKLNSKSDEEIALLQEEIKTWKSSQKKHENQIVELTNTLLAVRSQYRGIESVKQEMDQEVASNNNKIKALESEMELLLKELGRTKDDLEISKLNSQANEVRMSTFAQELLEKEVDKTKALGRLKEAQSNLQEYEHQNTRLKRSLNSLGCELRAKEEEVKQLYEKIQLMQSSCEISERKVAANDLKIEELQKAVVNNVAEVQFHTKRATEAEHECKDLIVKLFTANKKLEVLQNREKSLAEHVKRLQETKLQEEEKVNKLTNELSETKGKVEKLEESIHESELKATSLQKKLNSENAILKEQMMVSEENLTTKIEGMEQMLKSEKMKQGFGVELLKGVQKENQKLQRSLQDAQGKNLQTEEELKTALKHKQEHEEVARDLYAKQSQQSLQFELLTQRNTELMSAIRELEQKNIEQQEAHKQEILASSQETQLIKAEMTFLNKRRRAEEDELKSSIHEQERKISLLEGQLSRTRYSRDKFVKRVKQQDTAITQFHSMLSDSLNSVAADKTKTQKTIFGRYGSTGDDDHYYSD